MDLPAASHAKTPDPANAPPRRALDRRFAFAWLLLGAATLTLQAVYLRELLAVFWGSELVVGAALGSWLMLGGIGSALLGPALVRRSPAVAAWMAGLISLAVAGPATVPFIRAIPQLIGAEPGRLLSFGTGLAAALIALAPTGLLAGALFVWGTRTWREREGEATPSPGGPEGPPRQRHTDDAIGEGAAAARVYLWDNLGSVIGGLGLTAALVLGLPSNLLAAQAAALCAAAAAFLTAPARRRAAWRALAAAPAVLWLVHAVTPLGRTLDDASLALAFPGETILAHRETPAGQVVLTRRHEQTNAYGSGRFIGSPEIRREAEQVVHLALLLHPRPARVLLAGGVLAGWTEPALQHGAESIDLIEADESLADVLEDRLGWARGTRESSPGGTGVPPLRPRGASSSGRLRLRFGDPRMVLRCAPGAYDAVLLPGGSPDTFAQHRLVSAEFFAEAHAALRPGGLLAFPVPGPRSFQNRPHRLVLASIRESLRRALPVVRVISLEDGGFLFVGSDAPLPDAAAVRRRWTDRGITAREWIPEAVGMMVLGSADASLAAALDAESDARADRDFEPAAVGYQAALAQLTADGRESFWSRWLTDPGGARGTVAWGAALAVGLALLLPLAIPRRPDTPADMNAGPPPAAGVVAAGLAGLAGLTLEVLWLDGFQIVRGNLYREAASVLAMFMAGAGGGTWLRLRAARRGGSAPGAGDASPAGDALRSIRAAGRGVAALAVLAVVAGPILDLARASQDLGAALLPAANFLTGVLVGWTFAAAAGSGRSARSGSTGGIYGADLAGAAAGSFLSAGFLIPLLGLPRTGAVLAAACAPAAAALAAAGLNRRRAIAAVGLAAALITAGAVGATGRSARPAPPAPLSPAPRETVTREKSMMGTIARVTLAVPRGESGQAARGFDAAFAAMDRVDALLSDYRDDSEVARIRALPGSGATDLHPWTAEVLSLSSLVHALTGGAFDPTTRPALRLYRFTRQEEPPPPPEVLARAMAKVGWDKVKFDPAALRFTVGPDGADLDFGGIAKGFANDVAADALGAAGFGDALLTLGGEILALGRRADGGPWRVGIAHPREPGRLAAEIDIEPSEAASTSGDAEKYFLSGGDRQPHVLDPRTGKPAAGAPAAVTILFKPPPRAPGPLRRAGAVADALATGLLVAGAEHGLALVKPFRGAEAMFILEEAGGTLRVVATPGARERARLAGGVEWKKPPGR